MKRFLFYCLMLVILTSLKSFSQDTIKFTYDATGNRISRCITMHQKSGWITNPDTAYKKQEVIKDDSFGSKEIKIYPNPTQGNLLVEIPEDPDNPDGVEISVIDINGRKVIDLRNVPPRSNIDLNHQPNGLYFMNLKKGKTVSQWKIIKQ